MNATSVAEINKQVLNLWNTFYNDPKYQEKKTFENALMPQQYPEDLNLKAPVLFIGLNPSFSNERLGHWRRLERILKTSEENQDASEVQEAEVVLDPVLVAHGDSPELGEPSKQPFNFPPPFVAA
jgi:hypothetical protein